MTSVRELNGYRVVYMPDYPRAMKNDNWSGYVYEHIVVAEKHLKRSLQSNEVVHHLDGQKHNNRHENLLVLERSQHVKLHQWLNDGALTAKAVNEHGVNSGKATLVEPMYCLGCDMTLQDKAEKYCSATCMGFAARRVIHPTPDELRLLMQTESWSALGRRFGVSGNAVKKWAKKYKLIS